MQINEIFWPNFLGKHDIDLRLDRVLNFAEQLSNPQDQLQNVVHIAGTNGKGSTIAFLEAFLRGLGKSVNVYTSPHLVHFNERIKLNGRHISDSKLVEILHQCQTIEKKQNYKLTFFEGTTLACLIAFANFAAEYNLIETGLGGRLDATNIFTNKKLAIITRISKDHEEFLGSDILGIAREKAAIIDKAEQVIIAKQSDNKIREFLLNYAKNARVPAIDCESVELDFGLKDLPLLGKHQEDNFKAAYLALKYLIGQEMATRALKSYKEFVYWPARLQEINSPKIIKNLNAKSKVILDGGHNIDAAKMLAGFIRGETQKYQKIYLICNQTKDRDIKSFVAEFEGLDVKFYSYHFNHEKPFYNAKDLTDIFGDRYLGGYENWQDIFQLDRGGSSLFLICGSLFLAGNLILFGDS